MLSKKINLRQAIKTGVIILILILGESLLAQSVPAKPSNASTASENTDDRSAIVAAIRCFTSWDREGGNAESVKPCVYEKVQYQRVNGDGELIVYTPGFDFEGKGLDDYTPYITDLGIYGNMAIVKTHKHREAPKHAYMKAFVLYKLTDGWRITNVIWGRITPEY